MIAGVTVIILILLAANLMVLELYFQTKSENYNNILKVLRLESVAKTNHESIEQLNQACDSLIESNTSLIESFDILKKANDKLILENLRLAKEVVSISRGLFRFESDENVDN